MASKNLRNNYDTIRFISLLKNKSDEEKKIYTALLKASGVNFWNALSELILNSIYGPICFTARQKKILKPFKKDLKILASRDKSLKTRQRVLRKIGNRPLKQIIEAYGEKASPCGGGLPKQIEEPETTE